MDDIERKTILFIFWIVYLGNIVIMIFNFWNHKFDTQNIFTIVIGTIAIISRRMIRK
jgi:hypothetical protein